MRIDRIFPAVISLALISCKSIESEPEKDTFYHCGVVFGFQVSPAGELEEFKFFPPNKCGGGLPNVEVSLAWKKTACGYFSTQKHEPTYNAGQQPAMKYSYYLINPGRPAVVYPTKTAGSSESDPVIYVRDSILENKDNPEHACDRMVQEERKGNA